MNKKILDSYKNMNASTKAGFWFVICNFLQKGIAFISVPIFTRLMTADQYGYVSLYNAWEGIFMIFATLNISGSAYSRGLVDYEHKKFTSIIQAISTTFTIVLFIIVLVFKHFFVTITEINFHVIILMFIYFLFETGLSLWCVKERFNYKYKKLIFVILLNTVLTTLAGIVAVLVFKNKGEAKIIATLLVMILIALPFYIKNFSDGQKIFDKRIWQYALLFALPLIPHYLSNIVLNQSDKIMISKFCGVEAVAFYGVAYSIGSILRVLIDAIIASLTPWRYKCFKEKKYSEVNKASLKLLLVVGVIVVLINMLAPEVLMIFADKEYAQAVWVIPPIVLSMYFIFLYNFFSSVEFYFLQTRFMMIASIFSAALNVILNLLFINKYGYIACAYTTLFCYITYCVCHYIYMTIICKKKIDNEKIYDIRSIIYITILCIVTTVASTFTYNFLIIRYFLIFIITLLLFIFRNKILSIFKGVKS